ncbi:MAG: transposase, partial [Lachnospiraceae bacterium]|nr:transposase [Lachnospiraceae bacterium]
MAGKDITEKTLESFNDVFADILNVLLFNGKIIVKEGDLEQTVLRSFYKADGKLREQERDTAKFWNKLNFHISLFGLENETQAEDDLPLRVIGYDGAGYRDQLFFETDEEGKRRLNKNLRYPVITLVLYFGYKKRWDKPKNLLGCLQDMPAGILPFVNDYKINLFEIAWLSDEQVSMFKSDFKIVADYFVQMRKNNNYVPPHTDVKHIREVLELLSVMTNDRRFEYSINESDCEQKEIKNMNEWL